MPAIGQPAYDCLRNSLLIQAIAGIEWTAPPHHRSLAVMHEFDRQILVGELQRLPANAALAAATSASSRLVPFYSEFCNRSCWGDALALQNALEFAWDHAEGRRHRREQAKRQRAVAAKLAQLEPRDGFGWDYTCSHYAALSVASCIDYVLKERTVHAAAALEWVFNAAYRLAGYLLFKGIGPHKSTPESRRQAVAHPIVQMELARQRRDLDRLHVAAADAARAETIKVLRILGKRETTLPA